MRERERFRCYEVKIEESEKGQQPSGVEPRTPGLSRQCSATELRQPDNHQSSQSSIHPVCRVTVCCGMMQLGFGCQVTSYTNSCNLANRSVLFVCSCHMHKHPNKCVWTCLSTYISMSCEYHTLYLPLKCFV